MLSLNRFFNLNKMEAPDLALKHTLSAFENQYL